MVGHAAALGDHALKVMLNMMQRHPLIGAARGLGLLVGLELVKDRQSKTPARDEAEQVMYSALSEGLSFKVTMGNILTLTPPLTITQQQIDEALNIIDRCLEKVMRMD